MIQEQSKRLGAQRGFLLSTYHAELAKDPSSRATESSRSNVIALWHTIRQIYGKAVARDVANLVYTNTKLLLATQVGVQTRVLDGFDKEVEAEYCLIVEWVDHRTPRHRERQEGNTVYQGIRYIAVLAATPSRALAFSAVLITLLGMKSMSSFRTETS